jgi:hypothetical protein
VSAQKRWLAVATPNAVSWRVRVEAVGAVESLLARLRDDAAALPVLFGVDAPIGLPLAYAARHGGGTRDFPEFIAALAPDSPFFSVCDQLGEVSGARPFFPRTTSGSPRRQAHAERLGVAHHDALLRRCDLRTTDRPRAACLFWTLGANQVGKAAISLWRDLLLPAIHGAEPPALWPFDGDLAALRRRHKVTVAEVYPAEALSGLKPRWRGAKRRQADRASLAGEIAAWMSRLRAEPEPALAADLEHGFGNRPEAEDRFDSLLGLLAMLAVVQEQACGAAPDDPAIRWEGWILGQRPRTDNGIASF